MKKLLVLTGILVTLIFGFISYSNASVENPLSNITNILSTPTDRIKLTQIQIQDNQLVLTYNKNLYLSEYAPTKSMLPLFDKGHNGIEIIPEKPRDIKIGDIIAYQSNIVNGLIVHRVIDINQDNKGLYFITKGDNNQTQDPEKIRFNQIKYILIGVLY
jgi:signal peptidase I